MRRLAVIKFLQLLAVIPACAGIVQTPSHPTGRNLAPPSTPASGLRWDNAPAFLSGGMPTQLGSVSVRVNGQPAFIFFVCSARTNSSCPVDQINALTPLDPTVGAVQVIVTNEQSSSVPFLVGKRSVAPSILRWGNYHVATHADGSLVGPPALFPGLTRPAIPGEIITLWGVGFGLPTSALVNGAASQQGTLPKRPIVALVDSGIEVLFAGLVSPGLYQINIRIPSNLPDGDYLLAVAVLDDSDNVVFGPHRGLLSVQR